MDFGEKCMLANNLYVGEKTFNRSCKKLSVNSEFPAYDRQAISELKIFRLASHTPTGTTVNWLNLIPPIASLNIRFEHIQN